MPTKKELEAVALVQSIIEDPVMRRHLKKHYRGAIEDGASPLMPGHLAPGNTILTLRIGSEIKRWLFLLVAMKRGQTVADQEEGDDVFTTHGKGPGLYPEHSLLIPSCWSALKNCPTQLMSRWHPSPIWLSDEPFCHTSFRK